MRKRIFGVLGMVVLLIVPLALGGTEEAFAEIGININIGLPPLAFSTPPPVIVVPGTYVYAVPDIEVGLFFYQGHWYRPYEGRWYWATSYNGPWAYIELSRVPRVVVDLPPSAWRVPPGYHRIPYAEFREHWSRWEHERHWDRDRDWRAGWHGRPEGRGHEERGRGREEHGRH